MKILMGSDFHINEHKRLDDAVDALDQTLQHAEKLRPDRFVCLGDVFDKRRPTPKEIQTVNRWLMSLKEYVGKIILLEGNHDQDNGISALSYLQDLKVSCVDIIAPPTIANFDGHLFYLGHEHIDGAEADNGIKLSGGASLKKIMKDNDQCEVFAFGHFHKPQILEEQPLAFYAGSIYNKTFGEQNDEKRLWLFEDGKLIRTMPLRTRPMLQYDIVVRENIDENSPWEGMGWKDKIEGALIKIVYTGTKTALRQINEDGLKETFLKKYQAKELTIIYNVVDKSQPRNKKVSEGITEKQALEEYFRNRDIKNKKETIEYGLALIKESNV